MASDASANGIGVQSGLSVTTGAAVALTLPTYTDPVSGALLSKTPRHALIGIEANSVRFTVDGTAPTASVGVLLPAGSFIDWTDAETDYASNIRRAKFIGISGTATLQADFRG